MMFKTYKELNKEISKRNYENIVGLKSHITKKQYWHFLEVLPPVPTDKGFFLMEPLTHTDAGAIHLYFTEDKGKYYCEVASINTLVSNEKLIEYGFI